MNGVKSVIRGTLRQFGLKVSRIPRVNTSTAHEPVHPVATYCPWNRDREFQDAFARIDGCTLVDMYRCFELWKLVEQVAKLPEGSLIEVGVWRGGTGALIAKMAEKCGLREKVYLCDTFTGVVKAGSCDTLYQGGEHADTSRPLVEELLLQKMKLKNVEILEGIFPDDTGSLVSQQKFRFCHVDVDAYQSAKDVVEWVWDRLVPGGVIVYDDYGFSGCDGITRYVEEQIPMKDRLIIHNLNGHAVVVRIG